MLGRGEWSNLANNIQGVQARAVLYSSPSSSHNYGYTGLQSQLDKNSGTASAALLGRSSEVSLVAATPAQKVSEVAIASQSICADLRQEICRVAYGSASSSGWRLNRVAWLRCSVARTAPADSVRRRVGGILGDGYGDVFQRADMLRLREWSHCPVATAYGQKRLRPVSWPTEGGGGSGERMDEGWKAGGAAHDLNNSLFATSYCCVV